LNVTRGKIKQHSSPKGWKKFKKKGVFGREKLLLLFAAMTGWVLLKTFHDNRSKQSLVISRMLFLQSLTTTEDDYEGLNNNGKIPVTSLTFLVNFIGTFNRVVLFQKIQDNWSPRLKS